MPNPYDRMFPGQDPAQVAPDQSGSLPGLPPEYQNLQPGQFVPNPVVTPPNWVTPLPPPAFINPNYTQPNQVPSLPPAAPIPAPVPAQVPVPSQPGQAPGQAPAHHGSGQPDMVQAFDKRIAQSQAEQQQASQDLQQAILEGNQNIAGAYADQRVARQANAAELAAKQAEIQKHNQELDQIDAANLKQARDATIPDFWSGREGARVGSTIAVALAGIGAGLLGSTNNQAMTAIQHNIDQYFHREKERIDGLYKYAEAQGKLNTQTRLNYAQDLLNLKDQHSYVMQAAADRVNEVSALSKGAVEAKNQAFLASQLSEKANKDMLDVRKARSQIMLQASEAEKNRAQAKEAEARAKNGGYLTPAQSIQISLKTGKEIEQSFNEVTRKGGLNEQAHKLQQNIKLATEQPNNPAPFVGLLDSLVTAYSEGKVTQQQFNTWAAHIAPGADRLDQEIEKFRTGKPSKIQTRNLLDIALGRYNGIRSELKDAHDKYKAVTSGPEFQDKNMANMANRKEHEIFSTSPGFGGKEPDLGGAALSPNVSGQVPATTQVKLKDGTVAEFDASGRRVK